MLNLKYVILYVSDVARTIGFYTQAFACTKKFITPEGDYGELTTDGVTLAFASHALAQSHFAERYQPASKDGKPLGFELGFTTTDVAQALKQAVQAGAQAVTEVQTKPWGQQVAYVRDCNGFLVELCTPMS